MNEEASNMIVIEMEISAQEVIDLAQDKLRADGMDMKGKHIHGWLKKASPDGKAVVLSEGKSLAAIIRLEIVDDK